MANKTRVLFLCTHNSARSQMAEGLLRQAYGGRYDVYSAGSTPSRVHPLAAKMMAEAGVDISRQRSKGIKEFQGWDFDIVVTVCRSTVKLSCPFCSPLGSAGTPLLIRETLKRVGRFVEHGFDDPSDVEGSEEERINAFRRVRDEIKEWILEYFKQE
jgi:arsenate reductase